MIKAEYFVTGSDEPIAIEIKESISYEEMNHIINETVAHSFDDEGNYTPFAADAVKIGLILRFFTNIDAEHLQNTSDVYALLANSSIGDVIAERMVGTIKTVDVYVGKMVDAKLHESPIKPLLRVVNEFAAAMKSVDMEQLVTNALSEENIQDTLKLIKGNQE